MLLLHGFGASSAHWRHNVAGLAEQGYLVYAIDLIGFGASAQPSKNILPRLDNLVWARQVEAFLLEIMQVSQHRPAVLVGNSLGGLTALTIAALRPKLIAAVIAAPLPDPALMQPHTIHPRKPRRWQKKLQRWFIPLICNLLPLEILIPVIVRSFLLRKALQAAYHRSIRTDQELFHLIAQPARRRTAPQSLRAMSIGMALRSKQLTAPNLLRRLFSIKASFPFMLIWGRKDRFIPLPIGLKLQEQYPLLTLSILEQTGHCPHDESPADFNQAVLTWLDLNLVSDRQRA